MNKTVLLYLNDFKRLSCDAQVLSVAQDHDRTVIELDQTIFYPQGGGQPCDIGMITNQNTTFTVSDVRLVDGVAKHFGSFSGQPFSVGQQVTCTIDANRRLLNSRIHSAGHVLDCAVKLLQLSWEPGKGYHFSEGPYVEYKGSLASQDKESFKTRIEQVCNEIIARGCVITSTAMDKAQLATVCQHVPSYIPEDKPVRVVCIDGLYTPCGGTHVGTVADIRMMAIRKIKESDGIVRVSYDVAR